VKRTNSVSDVGVGGFHTIGEVSETTGVKSYILRYWEKEFPFLQPLKNKAGHRLYSQRDINIVRKIKELLYERGYSISGAKKVLWEVLLGKSGSQELTLKEGLDDVMGELRGLLAAIEKSLGDSRSA